jgi:alpha-N-acetylglucosamine transferase
MIVLKNMDELFDLPLAEGEIAATYACACNPFNKSHFPADWYVNYSQNHLLTDYP